MENIKLVDPNDIRTNRRNNEYRKMVGPLLRFLWRSIKKSKDGFVRIKIIDLLLEIYNPRYEYTSVFNKSPNTIYRNLKLRLFPHGIVVDTGETKNGDPLLIMRIRKDDDVLPPSLAKYLQRVEDEDYEELNKGNFDEYKIFVD